MIFLEKKKIYIYGFISNRAKLHATGRVPRLRIGEDLRNRGLTVNKPFWVNKQSRTGSGAT